MIMIVLVQKIQAINLIFMIEALTETEVSELVVFYSRVPNLFKYVVIGLFVQNISMNTVLVRSYL